MPKFRKKPVIIEAFQPALRDFDLEQRTLTDSPPMSWPSWAREAWLNGELDFDTNPNEATWLVKTLEDGSQGQAKHVGQPGDWLIRGVQGELYFCKPDIFEQTYEPADED